MIKSKEMIIEIKRKEEYILKEKDYEELSEIIVNFINEKTNINKN